MHDTLLRQVSSPARSVANEARILIDAGNHDQTTDDDNDWDFKSAVSIDDVERVGAKRRLKELQQNCSSLKR